MKFLLLTAAVLMTGSSSAQAHLVGRSLEKKVGNYLVDIGYDSMDITQGQEVAFNATLVENPGTLRWEYAPFDSVWFQIKKSGEETFRKVLMVRAPGPVNVSYTFEEAGEYQLAVAFLDGKTILAQTAFPLPVKEAGTMQNTAKSVALVLFALFLFLIVSIVWHRRHAMEPLSVTVAKPKPKTKAKPKRRAAARKPKA